MPTPCTVTANLSNLFGGNASFGTVTFSLTNIGTGNPIVAGGGGIVPALNVTASANQAGLVTTQLWGNDNINPANTLYSVTFRDANRSEIGPILFSITGSSANLNTLAPSNAIPPIFQSTSTSLNLQSLNNVVFADQFVGADIGAQINAAYAALPASGGKILIGGKPGGTMYSYSTPIVLNTSGKYVLLEGWGASGASGISTVGGVVLNYTPTTATAAITLDYVPTTTSPLSSSHGIRNLTIVNNNNLTTGSFTGSAVGIKIGTTNAGVYGASFENLSVIGFPIAFQNTNPLSVQTAFFNPQFFSNGIAISIGSITGLWIFGGQIAGNAEGIVASGAGVSAEMSLYGTEFFANTGLCIDWTGSASIATLQGFGVHFENSSGSATARFISGAINVLLYGGQMESERSGTVTSDWMMNVSGDSIIIDGVRFYTGANETVTSILVAQTPERGVMRGIIVSAGHFTNYVTGTNAGNITVEMLAGPSSTSAAPWTYESSIQAPTLTATAATPTVSSGQLGLGTTAGFGNGAAGTTVTTTLKGTGSGPATPQTVVNYLEVNIGGTNYWVALVQ